MASPGEQHPLDTRPPAPGTAGAASEGPAIVRLQVRVVNPPLATPHPTAGGLLATWPMVLLDLHTDDGLTGRAYVCAISPAFAPAIARLVRDIAPGLVGHEAAPQALQAALQRRFRLVGPHGFTMIAQSLVDMAAWDAACKRRGVPLHELLGGTARPSRPYAPVGLSGAADAAREAQAAAAAGFTGVKARLGYATLQEDLAVVRAIRQAIGDRVALMVDYNQALDVPEAIRRCTALDGEVELAWIEEPTTAADLAGHAQIRAAARTPIQAGENWWGPLEFRKAINAGASDLLMPDLMRIGGISNWGKIAAMGEAYGVPVSNHLFPEASAHLMALTPTAGWFEWTDWSQPVIAHPPALRDGLLHPDRHPGIGVEWNEDVVQRWLVVE